MALMDFLNENVSQQILNQIIGLLLLATAVLLTHYVAKRFLVTAIRAFTARSQAAWDDRLVDASVFARLANIVPALVCWYGIQFVPNLGDTATVLIRRLAVSGIILTVSLAASSFLTALNEIYSSSPDNRQRPIKGYIQVIKIAITLITGVLVMATLVDRSPLIFLSGIGAMAAVLLLVFRDTLLSLVASVQLTGNDMVHVGDWIEMPKFGADGDVVDIALHTVKVQNFDKTITTIPTHKLIEESFKNWRGMSKSGGRRIKRSILIDIQTIRFLSNEEVERLGRFALLRDYISRKTDEIRAHNETLGQAEPAIADTRQLSNVGTLRAYIESYLQSHPHIHRGMTLMVRQLEPTERGLSLEIYCFTKTTNWGQYEAIQADIMDHLFAMLSEFDLKAYQLPAGRDFELVSNT